MKVRETARHAAYELCGCVFFFFFLPFFFFFSFFFFSVRFLRCMHRRICFS